MEGAHFIKNKELISISEQELVDCSTPLPETRDATEGTSSKKKKKKMTFFSDYSVFSTV